MPETVDKIYVHVGANDLKKAGKVKGQLPWQLKQRLGKILDTLKQNARMLYFVVWGDWSTWRRGFRPDQIEEDGNRYDQFCKELLQMAMPHCTKTIHITGEKLNKLRLLPDNLHFALEAREGVRQLLQQMGAAVEVDEEVDSALGLALNDSQHKMVPLSRNPNNSTQMKVNCSGSRSGDAAVHKIGAVCEKSQLQPTETDPKEAVVAIYIETPLTPRVWTPTKQRESAQDGDTNLPSPRSDSSETTAFSTVGTDYSARTLNSEERDALTPPVWLPLMGVFYR
jgi:hypothetical protein